MPLISPLMPVPHHAAPLYIQCEIFDTRSQDVVDVCLEMFNCVPAEQTVAIRMAKFLKRVNNSITTFYVRHLLLKPQKNW